MTPRPAHKNVMHDKNNSIQIINETDNIEPLFFEIEVNIPKATAVVYSHRLKIVIVLVY